MPEQYVLTYDDTRPFTLVSSFSPSGDQPEAIARLTAGIRAGLRDQVLLGVTGSGKTFTMAQVVAQIQRPTLVLAPNKTLKAQLFAEFHELFPHNAVEYDAPSSASTAPSSTGPTSPAPAQTLSPGDFSSQEGYALSAAVKTAAQSCSSAPVWTPLSRGPPPGTPPTVRWPSPGCWVWRGKWPVPHGQPNSDGMG